MTSNSVHPGFIPGSRFWRFFPRPLASLFGAVGWMPGTASVADGAAELLHVAVSDATADATVRLWARSADLLGIDEPLPRDPAGPASESPS